MLTLDLNGKWLFKINGENIYGIAEGYMEAQVPGSVYGALYELGKIPDPFYRDNELTALQLMENDFTYVLNFDIAEELLNQDAVLLHFDGIDTLADVFLNGQLIGNTCNMHRIWEYDIKDAAHAGTNELKVILHSPTKYIKAEQEKCFAGGSGECMQGFPHLRKAHCMFGWDWGPRLPDAGIWRGVCILGVDKGRFDQVYVKQKHERHKVTLSFDYSIELFGRDSELSAKIQVTGPDGTVYKQDEEENVVIGNPQLWWPNGYGKQPLYTVKAELTDDGGRVLDVWERRIGLRTLTIHKEEDQWGESFTHEVNGVQIFAMGADYIPEDNLFGRINEGRTRRLLEDCIAANHNAIRVWGGGYYPDDYFYDICDELGLLVWQDFMFACADYELADAFEDNIRQEITENVIRLRHHASLALWCGNNEMETQTMDKFYNPSPKQYMDYIKIFEYIIPKLVAELDPQTFYWPSSPSTGGNYHDPWNYDRGDTHYWDVWHGNKPFSEYRKFFFRYASEFGFQSFPALKTIETFTEKGDRNIFSRVMEMHQRNKAANGKILNYISENYLYPKDFDNLIYTSQLLQADAIRYGVEHWRRNRGRCMGAIVWQLNDIWPVASWASIDYFGRWKALHYAEKRFFAPIMISCEEVGEMTERPHCIDEPVRIEKSARLNVANETMHPAVKGIVKWALRDPKARILKSGEAELSVPALSSCWLDKLDLSFCEELRNYFSYEFYMDGELVSGGTSLFTAPKHFEFADPGLKVTVNGNAITVKAEAYAKSVELSCEVGDMKLSDNYFDMNAGEATVYILEGNPAGIKVRSVFDIGML